MANTEGMAIMVFVVNGGIMAMIVLLLANLKGVRSWWSRQTEGKTAWTYSFILMFIHWSILPMDSIGEGIKFLDMEASFLNIWKYYWIDWGMRATLLFIFPFYLAPYALLVIIGGIWPIHFIHRPGGFMTYVAYGVGMPVVYGIGLGWILIPFLTS